MPRVLFVAFLLNAFFSTLSAQPQKVYTGVYLMNLYNLNMDEHSFYADFYIWFKWKGSIDPTQIEYVNMIEKWSINVAGFDGDSTPVKLKDGSNYKIYRVEGRFSHPFSLDRFPLDRHALDIQIENPEWPVDSLVYLPDTAASASIRPTFNFVGWNCKGAQLKNSTHDYRNNFGNPEENATRFSNLTFTVVLDRPFSFFMLKMFLPIALVMLVSIGGLLLHPNHIDTRSSLPIGGLLTAVFLQQTYNNTLPDSGSMVLMDKIYLLGYVIIALVLFQIIRAGNLTANGISVDGEIRQDKKYALAFALLFLFGTLWLCLS